MKKALKILSLLLVTFAMFSMKSSNLSKSQENKGPFWGTSCGEVWCMPNGQCYQTCCYYVFWINTGCEIVGAGNQQQ
ncbi:hypothetical protein [Planktosalinus lacus]|uniref:Uncharacterized protein n=1 Tax=Planktosalinus lacus TaxID=1526573 RepID=A0A8J2VAS8_9FLAO|nr:hypothetical protein [Planktosalinus lacus]GGD95806.1 hypothetical protein GCM10011312_19330 [Planktosalinus lacus]